MDSMIYIVVLNWNGTDDTIECLKSIKNIDYNYYTTIIVDNGSDKSNLQILKDWCFDNFKSVLSYCKEEAENGGVVEYEKTFEKVNSKEKLVFIDNNENLGFAVGNNVALKYILKKNGNNAMLLNNDTVVEKNAITKLMNYLTANDDYVALTPQIRYFDPSNIIWNCGGKITWFGNRRYFYAGENISKIPKIALSEITFITGCALLFRPRVTGLLSEQFFFGEEDFEFSLRLLKNKQKIACIYDSIIYHKVGGSFNKYSKLSLNGIFLHYASRLIDHKAYYSTFYSRIIRVINLTYGFYLTSMRYKIGIRKSLKFWFEVNNYSIKHNEIKKSDFNNIMKLNF
ncbi:MAG: glycosyltransferase family 2 protein [Bacteroidales bacterium]